MCRGRPAWSCTLLQAVVALLLFGCVRRTGAATLLGLSQLGGKEETHRLVTDGCYSFVRHPLYLYSTLFLILNPIMTLEWALLTALSVPYFIIGGLIEERRLEAEFGDRYRRYRSRVPFMIPRLRVTRHFPAE